MLRTSLLAPHRPPPQCLPALISSSERPCGVDRVPRPRVGRVCSLEDLQDFLSALSGVTGDLTKVLHAQNDLAGFVRHGVLVYNTGHRWPPETALTPGHLAAGRRTARRSQPAPSTWPRAPGSLRGPSAPGSGALDRLAPEPARPRVPAQRS